MDDERRILDRLGALEGADPTALGIEPPPEPAPPGAHVEDEERLVPGPRFDEILPTDPKPWFTTLAAESHQAGVGNDPPFSEEPESSANPEDAG